jgi:hypothetical protein
MLHLKTLLAEDLLFLMRQREATDAGLSVFRKDQNESPILFYDSKRVHHQIGGWVVLGGFRKARVFN